MAREIIFLNLEAELVRAKITKSDLAATIGISGGAMSSKITGKTEFNLEEMLAIQKRIESVTKQEFTLDYLFKRGE